jgi:enterochelin esterase family protein
MFGCFSHDAIRAFESAHELAKRAGDGRFDDVHWLYGCTQASGSLATLLLRSLGMDPARIAAWAEEHERSLGPGIGTTATSQTITQAAQAAIDAAMAEAEEHDHAWLGTHHILVGLLQCGGSAAQHLKSLGLTLERARSAMFDVQADAAPAKVAVLPSKALHELLFLRGCEQARTNLQERELADARHAPIRRVERREPTRPSMQAQLGLRGRVDQPLFDSVRLHGNRAGDPHVREVPVYLPPQANDPRARFPVVFLLAGFSGTGRDFLETHPWKLGVAARFDRAVAAGEMPPAILVMPNCFTKYGGSQYVNSRYLGEYESYVAQELTSFVDNRYPTLRGRRAVVGKSSGGFGAMHLSMRHPDVFPVAASLSGDCAFEWCYGPGFLACLRALIPHGGDPARFLEAFLAKPDPSGDAHEAINTFAMAACYSPNPDSPLGFDLPFDLRTGARIESVWKRWLEFDPLHACERHADHWKKLELLHLECGLLDEYHLQWGLRQLSDKLKRLGVPHVHEEHAGAHRGIDHRYLAVLPKLIAALSRNDAGR